MKSLRAVFVVAMALMLAGGAVAEDQVFMGYNIEAQEMTVIVRNPDVPVTAVVDLDQTVPGGFVGPCECIIISANEQWFRAEVHPNGDDGRMDIPEGTTQYISAHIVITSPGLDDDVVYDITDQPLVVEVCGEGSPPEGCYTYEDPCTPDFSEIEATGGMIQIATSYCVYVCHATYTIPLFCEAEGYTPELLDMILTITNGCGADTPCDSDPECRRVDWDLFAYNVFSFPGCYLFLQFTSCDELPGCICITRADFYLPVEMLGFSAMAGDGQVTLNWSTASETDNKYFHIARATDPAAPVWTRVATVNGAESSAQRHDYVWTDESVVNGTTYYYRLESEDIQGGINVYAVNGEVVILEATPQSSSGVAGEYRLDQNYPNPFNSETVFSFAIAEPGFVSLKVYDLLGREVAEVLNGNMEAKHYTVHWNADGLPTGVYMYTLNAGSFSDTKKLLYLK